MGTSQRNTQHHELRKQWTFIQPITYNSHQLVTGWHIRLSLLRECEGWVQSHSRSWKNRWCQIMRLFGDSSLHLILLRSISTVVINVLYYLSLNGWIMKQRSLAYRWFFSMKWIPTHQNHNMMLRLPVWTRVLMFGVGQTWFTTPPFPYYFYVCEVNNVL